MIEPAQPPHRGTQSVPPSQGPNLEKVSWQTQLVAMLMISSGMAGLQHEKEQAAEKVLQQGSGLAGAPWQMQLMGMLMISHGINVVRSGTHGAKKGTKAQGIEKK